MPRLSVWMHIEDEAAGKSADFIFDDPAIVSSAKEYARYSVPADAEPGHFRENVVWAVAGDLREIVFAWNGREAARFNKALRRTEPESMILLVWDD